MRIPALFTCVLIGSVIYSADTKWIPNFFVPEEIQTILQLVYSRLPPTKIGSDKRFGVGFRLGRNADAQILIELGPQSETQPLADPGNGFSKRQSRQNPSADFKRTYPKTDDKKRNQTRAADEKRTALTTNNLENNIDTNAPVKPEPLWNMFMRWINWLIQPREGSVKNARLDKNRQNNVKRTKEDNKLNSDRTINDAKNRTNIV